ncbi:MAG TPA: M23 family metallopeptidase [bacterium]|nr:M23 family metallopeptidase [bacterium]
MRRVRLILAILGMCLSTVHAAASPPTTYQRITSLSMSDIVFKQVQDSISQGYRAEKLADTFPDLFFCLWTAAGGEDLYAVAARLALPYETLATLNGIGRPRLLAVGEDLIVPSIAGVFVPDQARNDLDLLLSARLEEAGSMALRVMVDTKAGRVGFTFYPGARFYGTERSFFLNVGFRMPLSKAVLTSGFGFRKSPIDGHDRMHEGIDLAAPEGTEVLAAREGTVIFIGRDPVLGLHVIVAHEGGIQTVYGHLSSATVVLNQTVRSGTIVGAVGSTGLSTGPHLHFEIRLSGAARDPSSYLPGLKR